ncbi:MAG: hypothetical protein HC880_22250, partial [Bacteroidia bacterium]|nr:hypothetical protein [Bacteroidia bacterium]
MYIQETNREFLFLSAGRPGMGRELIRVDGANILMVRDIFPGENGSDPRNFGALNGQAFFFVNERSSEGVGNLWRSNGISFPVSNTSRVKIIYRGNNSQARSLVTVGNQMFFVATSQANNEELWISDGTEVGTVLSNDINPTGSSFPEEITGIEIAGQPYLFFTADASPGAARGNAAANRELWIRNPNTGQASAIEINPTGGSNPKYLTFYKGFCYFIANDGSGSRLWRSDGTLLGTQPVNTLGANIDSTVSLVVSNNILYFVASRPAEGNELWQFNGFNATLVKDIRPGSASASPHKLCDVRGTLYFAATTDAHGTELWKKAPSEAVADSPLADVVPGTGSSFPSLLTEVNGLLYFFVQNFKPDFPDKGFLWVSDPATNETRLFYDFEGEGASDYEQITPVGNNFYFVAQGKGPLSPSGIVDNPGIELWFVQNCTQVALSYHPEPDANNVLCKSAGTVPPILKFSPTPTPANICPTGNCFSSPDAALVLNPTT